MPHLRRLATALLAAPPVLGACVLSACATTDADHRGPSAYLRAAPELELAGESIAGTVFDVDGRPVAAKVWTVREGGGTSTGGTRADFDLATLDTAPFNLTVQTADGAFLSLLDCVPTAEALPVIATEPGAWLTITNESATDERVVVRHDGATILAFTVRAGESTRQLVPAGPIDVSMPALSERVERLDLEPRRSADVAFGAAE